MKQPLQAILALTILMSTLALAITNSQVLTTNAAATHDVIIFDLAFNPQNLTLDVGDTVSWQNNDPLIYTIWFTNISDGSTYLLSNPILPGDTWAWTFDEPVALQYYSLERLWITGFINVQAAIMPITGVVGISGYKLVFKETMSNSLDLPAVIDYHWNFTVDKWDGTQWAATGISGLSTPVAGYSIPALSTVGLPYYVYLLSTSGVAWGDWLKVNFTFHWTYICTNYSTTYSAKLHVHPGDIAGTTVAFPYLGADLKDGILDVNPIAFNWGVTVSWTGSTINPTDQLHRASITMGTRIGISDVNPVAFNWGKTWTNTPPLG
jgi:plastocyanin